MKRRWDVTIASALAISAAINVYLLVREPAASAPTSDGATPASEHGVAVPAPAPRPIGLLPADIDSALPCEAQLTAVQGRIAATQPEIAKRLSPKDKFEAGTSDPAAESTIKPKLEKLFADAPDELGYEVECRSGICRLTVHQGGSDYDWVDRVHDPEFRSRYGSMMFHGSSAYMEPRQRW